MAVNGEYEVGITRHGNNTQAIAFKLLYLDDGQWDGRTARETTFSVNKGRICDWRRLTLGTEGSVMIPVI